MQASSVTVGALLYHSFMTVSFFFLSLQFIFSVANSLIPSCRVLYKNAVMGKLEEQPPSMRHSEHYTPWHGHITVLTVAPAWRRLGYARRLTESLEHVSDINAAWFVDLYVRAGNKVAVGMYKGMG